MAHKFSRRKLPTDSDLSTGGKGLSSVPESVPNSAGFDPMHNSGMEGSIPNSAMHALMGQRQAAEQEADRLSEGVTSGTPDTLRREMGERLGADFSGVRFHNNKQSAEQAGSMGARAFTKGKDIYFGDEGFNSEVAAHEMVHTVQQGAVKGAAGTVSQSVPLGTTQMWSWSWPWKRRRRAPRVLDPRVDQTIEKIPENTEEKEFKQLERLFRIQAGLNAGDPDLVSNADRDWFKKTMKNLSPNMIREILKRRDEKSVELMDLRNKMDEEPNEFKTRDQMNYDARNSSAAYDMNIYHMLASKAQSNVENFFIGNTINNRKRDKRTAAAVRDAYALMRDRAYNLTDETFEETQARKQGFRQMSAQVYKNKNMYVDYSDSNKKISRGWSVVGKEGNEAKVTGETNIINEGFRQDEPKEFVNGEQAAANNFFGYGNDGTYDDWEARLKLPERTSLADYTGNERVRGNFREINSPLRDQLPMEPDLQNRVKSINNAMNKYELGDDLIVYRGCSGDLFGGLYEADEIRKNYLGRVVRDRGFVSTSAVKGKQFIKKNIQLKIRVPHGKGRGAFISPLSHYPKEHEFLLKNNSSFRVTNVYSDPAQHHTWVEMDLIT